MPLVVNVNCPCELCGVEGVNIRFSLYVYTDSTSKRCNKREATDASTVTVASKAGRGSMR
jgi:hypothetical protein